MAVIGMQLQRGNYQFINIGTNDETVRGAARQIFHVLGRNYESVRRDRNYYIQILWDNIKAGRPVPVTITISSNTHAFSLLHV